MKSRNILDNIKLFFKGILMGIADTVPGVSGGTIALLVGIYEELINTISKISFGLLIDLKNKGFKQFWKKINGNFLIVLVSGISLGLLSSAIIFTELYINYPLYVWSFFLGLILSTIYLISKLIGKLNLVNVLFIFIGCISTFCLTLFPEFVANDVKLYYIIICGIIAASAMILPGISGSLILMILGVHQFILDSLKNLDILIISAFGVGAIIGLLAFSKIIKYLFDNYRNITYSIMLGLIIGSLAIVKKEIDELITTNLDYNDIFNSIILVLLGFSIILILEKINTKNK
tara:strand:- start:9748 stop:10617 length:870 start_codon:yes stop_codon:yes gene_type:complete